MMSLNGSALCVLAEWLTQSPSFVRRHCCATPRNASHRRSLRLEYSMEEARVPFPNYYLLTLSTSEAQQAAAPRMAARGTDRRAGARGVYNRLDYSWHTTTSQPLTAAVIMAY